MARTSRATPPRRRGCFGIAFRVVLLLGFFAALGSATAVVTLVWFYGQELPDIRNAQDYRPSEISRVYASSGEVIASFTDRESTHRTVVPWETIPEVMRDAILAAEDADFFRHPGVDYRGILRAFLTNVRRREMAQGASTITQQVVKNLVLSPERSLRRKIQEALLAWRLEQHLGKEEILWLYLNQVFFGSRYYGVEEASRYYFGHGCADLTLPEAALLAGLVQSPNRYNPYRHPERALERRAYVLRQMRAKGFISEGAYHEANDAPLTLADPEGIDPWHGRFPWFVDAVRRDLLEVYPPEAVFGGGLQIETTLRIDASVAAQAALARGLEAWDDRHGWLRPLRQLDGDDAIRAWREREHGDLATLGLRRDTPYRAVVLATTEDEVILGVGAWEFLLHLQPLDRLTPGDRTLADVFPRGAVFTVESPEAVPVAGLGEPPVPGRDDEVRRRRLRMVETIEGAIVVLERGTRDVVAIAGGYDFGHSNFNRAVQARRQTGSAFKPFIYAAALDARQIHAAEVFPDQPITFRLHGGRLWSPQNYDGRYLGPMSVREALARSRNVIVVSILDRLGVSRATSFLREMGIGGPLPDNLTLALGSAELTPHEMTEAFATLADDGVWRPARRVVAVRSRLDWGAWPAPEPPRAVIAPDVAWLTGSLLRSVVESGTATAARRLGHPAAGKTGTTNGPRDAWFVGWTGHFVTGVWLGRDDNGEIGRRETGGSAGVPIWLDAMTPLHEGLEVLPFPDPPPGLVEALVDPATGLRARPGRDGARSEFFLEGTEPSTWAPEAGERAPSRTLLGTFDDEGGGGQVPSGWDDGF